MSCRHFGYDSEILTNGVLGMEDKGEQHYVIVGKDEIKQEGDLFWHRSQRRWQKTEDAGTCGAIDLAYIRPVDPEPVNPWTKGSDRLPTLEDAIDGAISVWRVNRPHTLHVSVVSDADYWRPIDQTPPPADPTIEELFEKLLTIVESQLKNSSYAAVNEAMEVAADIRNLQESEGRDVER